MIRRPAEVLAALERECLAVDAAIVALDWERCEASWREQRRLTHELNLAMHQLPPDSEEAVIARKRIDRLVLYRDGQITRLRSFNQAVGKRLATLGKYRSFARSRGTPERPSSILDLNS
jgi:hypothetical protein